MNCKTIKKVLFFGLVCFGCNLFASQKSLKQQLAENEAIIEALRNQSRAITYREELQNYGNDCLDFLKKTWVAVYFCVSAISAERRQDHQD